MEIIKLPQENYSVSKLQHIYENGQLKDHIEAFNYIQSYYFEINCGMYYFYDFERDTFDLKTDKDFRKEVLDKLDDKKLFKVICKIGKPRIYKYNNTYYINETGSFKHQTYKKFNDYSQDIKAKVQMILDMIKTISCDNNDEMFKATMKYYGKIARGQKTEVILVKKTAAQGVGKSTEPEFFMEYVFGMKVSYLMPSSLEPLLTQFNKSLLGKLFIVIEDLQDLTDSQWKQTTAKLKTLTTEKYCFYRDVFEKGFQAENIFNFMITSNHAIGDTQGRRIISQDISLVKKGDTSYFGNIRKNCFNNEVGEAMFSYLLTVITDEECDKFYAQRDFPETDNKRIAISTALSSPYKFLKIEYVLKNEDIKKIKRKDLYADYTAFCSNNQMRKCGLMEFYKKLEEINIKSYSSNGADYFKVDIATLKDIATNEKWLCRFDDAIDENKKEKSPLDNGLTDDDDNENIVDIQKLEIDLLKEQIEELKKLLEVAKKQNPLDTGIEMIPETIVEIEDKEDDKIVNKDDVIIYDDEIDDDELNDMMLEIKEVKPKYKSKSKSKSKSETKATFSLTKD